MAPRKPRREISSKTLGPPEPDPILKWWMLPAAFFTLIAVYAPSFQGPAIFDDAELPIFRGGEPTSWLSYFSGVRPLFYLSLHVNSLFSGREMLWYHLPNLLFHFLNGCLIYMILCKLLELGGSLKREASQLSLIGAGIFLFHPLQTEAVAYIASRSENLSALFAYSALAVFLGSVRDKISWGRAIIVLALLVAGVLTKEHVAAMAGVIVLVDWWANGRSLSPAFKNRWKLHVPLALGACLAVPALILFIGRNSGGSAGFSLRDSTWYRYLFTQFKVVWIYIGLFLVPFRQSIDYGIPPVRSIFEPLVVLGLMCLLGWFYLAWKFRDNYPVLFIGTLVFITLLTPTSSVVPIADTFAERRAYLPGLGLLLIGLEFLRHQVNSIWKRVLPWCFIAIMGIACWSRCHVFSSAIALWEEATNTCPQNWRAWTQLGVAYTLAGRCSEAAGTYLRAEALGRREEGIYINMAAAFYCDHAYDRAANAFRKALSVSPRATTWAFLAETYGNEGHWDEAKKALEEAFGRDPNCAIAYRVSGGIFLKLRQPEESAVAYRRALASNPDDFQSRMGLSAAEQAIVEKRQAGGPFQK